MDSDSYLERRTGHLSRYDLEEPHFQHKRRMNGSPSRYAREPDLPIRKKVPKDEELNNNSSSFNNRNDDDFIILGDQSKFRLNMIPYRTRSHSAPRYSDSTDMLTWLGNGDDDFDHHYQHRHRSRTRNRHVDESQNNNNTMVSDSHYHNCEDEPANRSLALQQLPRNDDNNREFDESNIKIRMQSPKKSEQNSPLNEDHKKVKVHSPEVTRTKSKQAAQQSTQKKSASSRPNSTRMNALNSNSNNKKHSTTTFAAPRTKWNANGKSDPRFQLNKTDKTSKIEFRTKSDIGKYLNDRRKERMKQNPKNAAIEELRRNDEDDGDDESESSARGKRREKEKTAGKKSATSNESLGAAIASRSQQNKENVNNNVVINEEVLNQLDHAENEEHHHHHQARSSHPHHSSHRSLSEYQDKFRWRGESRPPLTTSSNLMKSQQPRLTWLASEAPLGDVRSEYRDQFRPRSALERHRNHNHHHHNIMRDGNCSNDDAHQNENYVHPDLASNQGINQDGFAGTNHQSWRGGDEDDYAEGYDGQFASRMHGHSILPQHENRHFKSEYAVKFIPPSDYLLVEGVWVKADHVQRILGDSAEGRGARWGEVRNGSGYHDRSLTAADLGANSTPYGGRIPVTNDVDVVDNNSNNMALEGRSRPQHLGDSWFDYILELRRKADEYRNRGFGVNFSRDHLAQIRSKNLRYWDESSLDSITAEEEALHDRIGQRYNTVTQPTVNAIHHSASNKVPGFFGFNQKFGTNPANQSDHENSALHNNNPSSNQQHNNNLATYPGRHNDDPIRRTNHINEVNLHKPRRRSNPIGGDSDDLASSLSSSLSLAEEVLERARTRKDRLWTTK